MSEDELKEILYKLKMQRAVLSYEIQPQHVLAELQALSEEIATLENMINDLEESLP